MDCTKEITAKVIEKAKVNFVKEITPGSGAVGTAVIITGSGFGTTKGTATFNGTTATITSWTDTEIKTTVPTGATTGYVVVTDSNGVASNGVMFTVITNIITSTECNKAGTISITSIAPAEGTVLTANGNYTFNVTVQYDFLTSTPNSIGINVSNVGNNLDNQSQHGASVSTQSGTANVSVSTTMSYQGGAVNSATVTAALFAQGFNCTYVSAYKTYTVQ